MARDGSATRKKILDASETLILEHGFGSTSVDKVVTKAGITKGTFFYHFKSKDELGRALIERYVELDHQLLDDAMARADRLSKDPLQRTLILLGLFIERTEVMDEPAPGCLIASFCYERELFDADTTQIGADSFLYWRNHLKSRLEAVAARYPPRLEVDLESLADGITVAFEGAFVLSRMLDDPRMVNKQLIHYRNYIELLFGPAQG